MSSHWISICHVQDLVSNSGVCALVGDVQVAIFSLLSGKDERLFAISNWDPIGQANVLYRGLLGSAQDTLFVASPLYKQRFCLTSGQCLDNESVRVQVWATRIVDQQVQLQLAA